MPSDNFVELMHGQIEAYPFKQETHILIGCAFEVLNGVGHGFHEKCYENAFGIELRRRGIGFEHQSQFEIRYLGEVVGLFVPDLIAFGKVVIEIKVIDRISNHERGQMLNYLRITRLPVGIIFNFKHTRMTWERVILSEIVNRGSTPETASKTADALSAARRKPKLNG